MKRAKQTEQKSKSGLLDIAAMGEIRTRGFKKDKKAPKGNAWFSQTDKIYSPAPQPKAIPKKFYILAQSSAAKVCSPASPQFLLL